MHIQQKQVRENGIFYVEVDGAIGAKLFYHIDSQGNMVIEHTEVGDEFQGKGVGKKLVQTAVDYAKTHQMKIIPLCPYANSLFKRTPEWKSLLADGRRMTDDDDR